MFKKGEYLVGLEDILTRLKAVLLEKLAGSVWGSGLNATFNYN